jgi:vancomycin resistance protein YoaR
MSREEARKAIEEQYQWGMKVTYHDKEYALKDLMDEKIDALLEEIYNGEPKESYTLDTEGLEDEIQTEVKAIADQWDVAAKNGSISGFDKATGKFTYAGEQNGIVIDQDKLTADILAQLKAKNFQAVIEATGNEVAPKITEAQAKELYKVIGTYTTTTTANKDRNKNIELASSALNGLILQPGEEFSFNKTTGERSLAKGYRPAGAYVNGVLVEEPGGGVCQVSSTLYNAVVFAGLTTTERHAHSYEPTYVTPGEDAMVSYGGPDMKFINNSSSAIAIRTSFADRSLKISIVGIPILEDGVTLSMTSKKTTELDAPAPVYEEDQTLQPGVEKVLQEEKKGSRWVTNLVTKKDGVVISDELLHNSTYRGKPATISRNTSGVVVTQADTSNSAAEDSTDISQTTAGPGVSPGQTTAAPPETQTQADKPTSEEPQTQGPSSTVGAPGDNGGQNVIQPNPLG